MVWQYIKKYGFGGILACATLDGYRRTVINDRNNKILDEIEESKKNLNSQEKEMIDKQIQDALQKEETKLVIDDCKESADNVKKAAERYSLDNTLYNKNELDKATKKMDEAFARVRKLDISEIFSSLYNNYIEYLDSLTPDKIVCLFNLIINGLIFSSFFSILSIMLSENIINKIVFLEKYPRILNLIKIRNNINKKVSKFYLYMHLNCIIFGFIGNLYMFFI